MKKLTEKGFTLIELMIVIAIIALLASVALPKFADSSDEAKVANVQGNLANLRTSISMFKVKHSTYPTTGAIEADGGLSETFQKYYSRTEMPYTPAFDGNDAANTVTYGDPDTVGDDAGGWVYNTSTGAIHANLPEKAYTDDDPAWDTE